MARSFYPMANSPILNDVAWRRFARLWARTGVVRPADVSVAAFNPALLVYADSSGMNVKVSAGEAVIDGGYFSDDTTVTLAIGTADATLPRIDRVVLRWDGPGNVAEYIVLQGTAAATPSAPGLTQNQGGRWELPLGQVAVAAAATTIAAGNVTDQRAYAVALVPPASATVAGTLAAADKAALDAARGAGIVVRTFVIPIYGVGGDPVYVNATTGWTTLGPTLIGGMATNLPAAPAGATRRSWFETVYQAGNSGTSNNIWFMSGGAPGTGTNQAIVPLPFTGAATANHRQWRRDGGALPNGVDITPYASAGNGGTIRIWSITLVVEDYIA